MALEFVLALAAIAIVLFLLYMLYTAAHRSFEAVGFTRAQAGGLLLGTFLLSAIDVPIWAANGWTLAVNLGGAGVPAVLAVWLIAERPSMATEALAAVALVAIPAYLLVDVTPEGISAPFHIAIIPALTAAAISLVAHWRNETYAAPLAFIGGALGSLVGADLLHLGDFLAQPVPAGSRGFVSIGGAGVFDMVFLSAILAVGLDLLFFRRVRREHGGAVPWDEGDVFTTSTPPEVIRDWKFPVRASAKRKEAPRLEPRKQTVRGLSGTEVPRRP